MGAMSDLHLLATRVVERGEKIERAAEDTTYSVDDIQWAVDELRQA